jgi:GTP cyclohydrolase II
MYMLDPLIEVDRVISELRRGGMVRVEHSGSSIVMLAVDALNADNYKLLSQFDSSPLGLVLTGTRLNVLGIDKSDRPISVLTSANNLSLDLVEFLANPLSVLMSPPSLDELNIRDANTLEASCITLAKLSRLLPAALVIQDVPMTDIPTVKASLIDDYMKNAANSLTQVSQARVPLENAEDAQVIAFRPRDGGIEHLAIIIGKIDPLKPVLVRLHSECFTGDLVGSLRCDCGSQLRGAISEMSKSGSGILLYLAQEGRGIGLVNKLRAYQLQDSGFDTVDANLQLGFDADERNYLPAAQMLQILGIHQVRLMTNNPAKVDSLERCGIEVSERVPHIYPSNKHNDEYLRVKAKKSGHLFEI